MDQSGRKSVVYETREEAEMIKARLIEKSRDKIDETIEESLDAYRDYRIKFRGVKPQTAEDHCRHLRDMLPLDWTISTLTAEKARRLYQDYAERPNKRNGKPLSPNTHQWVLRIAKCWGKWCVDSKLASSNPFDKVEPIGKRNAGKHQLRIDEAQLLNKLLIERAQAGDQAALGVLMMLHLGMRKGEVSARVVRDVDADGRVLVIPFGKTEGSRRRLRVPEWLRPLLLARTQGRASGELLFSEDGKQQRSGGYWWRKVHEFCEQAGVPLVCPHSLRGLHATLAIEEGATSDAVARALGHTSFAMTAKHYASADSVINARVTRASHLLAPREAEPPPPPSAADPVSELLALLTPAQMQELKRRLSA